MPCCNAVEFNFNMVNYDTMVWYGNYHYHTIQCSIQCSNGQGTPQISLRTKYIPYLALLWTNYGFLLRAFSRVFTDCLMLRHDDVIKWKHFPCYRPLVRGIHRWPVDSPHKAQWCGAFMFPLICTWTNGWANYQDASDLRCHPAHYDVTVITQIYGTPVRLCTDDLLGTWASAILSRPS